MQCSCGEFLPRSSGAGDQNVSEMRCDAADFCEQLEDERTPSDHVLELIGLQEFLIQRERPLAACGFSHELSDSRFQFEEVRRFNKIVTGPFLNCLNRRFG